MYPADVGLTMDQASWLGLGPACDWRSPCPPSPGLSCGYWPPGNCPSLLHPGSFLKGAILSSTAMSSKIKTARQVLTPQL